MFKIAGRMACLLHIRALSITALLHERWHRRSICACVSGLEHLATKRREGFEKTSRRVCRLLLFTHSEDFFRFKYLQINNNVAKYKIRKNLGKIVRKYTAKSATLYQLLEILWVISFNQIKKINWPNFHLIKTNSNKL